MNAIAPPHVATLLVECVVTDPSMRDGVIGDLFEEFAERSEGEGLRSARDWYWNQAIRSAPSLLATSARTAGLRDYVSFCGSIIIAYMAIAILVLVGNTGLYFALANANDLTKGWVSLLLAFWCAVVGGYVAAALRPRSPLLAGLALGMFCVLLGILMFSDSANIAPVWSRVALVVMVIPGAVTGAVLRRHLKLGDS